jgi:hypothetical protein
MTTEQIDACETIKDLTALGVKESSIVSATKTALKSAAKEAEKREYLKALGKNPELLAKVKALAGKK